MKQRLALTVGLLLMSCFTLPVFARITPQQIAIVINMQDGDSREIAEYYRSKRGIPEQNLPLFRRQHPAIAAFVRS